MKITNLQTCHVSEPIGYDLSSPVFTWSITDTDAKKQLWALVEVFQDGVPVWQSEKSADVRPNLCAETPTLRPRTRYDWRVTVMADSGECASASSFFETGKCGEPWAGHWIGTPFESGVHPCLRRSFTLDAPVRSARLYICGLGLYEAELNGVRVGDEYLTPYCNDYNLWLQYQSFDVTALLQRGGNVLGVTLANGWYRGEFGWEALRTPELFGSRMKLMAELRAVLCDGREVIVASDDAWRCAPSAIVGSQIYDGEIYDARREISGWSRLVQTPVGFVPVVSESAPAAPLCERLSLPVRRCERFEHPVILHTPKGETVLDFGQIISGWVEFSCHLPEGNCVTLRYGELLQDGCFYRENLRSAKQEYTFISDGNAHFLRPHFTYYGFRYVQVEGLAEEALHDMTAVALHTDLPRTGRVVTSNPKLNRLIANSEWGQLGNFVDVPTDCNQRDERLGWTGDAQVYAATACLNRGSAAFYRKYLRDMALEQARLGGSVPHVVPDLLAPLFARNDVRDIPATHGSCAWSDAATVIPWTLYQIYGDRALLREQYENMRLWTECLIEEDEAHGAPHLRQWGFHYGDWLAVGPMRTEPYFVASMYYFYSLQLTAKAAKVLSKTEDEARYTRIADEVLQALRQEYFTPTGRLAIPTQTAYAMVLAMGVVPQAHRARLVQDLRARLEQDRSSITTGFIGTYFLCAALTENGLSEQAYTLLLNEDLPSWLYEVNMGATTIWERWNSILPDGRISDTGMNSLNHYAYGSILEWMYRYLCGICPTDGDENGPGILLRPVPSRRLAHAGAAFDAVSGRFECGWIWEGELLRFHVRVPFNAQAYFLLPEGCGEATLDGAPCAALTQEGRVLLDAGVHALTARVDADALR